MIAKLSLENLQLKYGKNRIGGPINAEFRPGRLNLIVGRAGSGKSTLLKAIAGFHRQYHGSILADGEKFVAEGNIALAFQNPENLFFNPKVGEEVCFALKQKAEAQDQDHEEHGRVWLEKWGLNADKFWFKHPIELSGGEKRKVALAACTVLLPDVILLDEPLAGLDISGQSKLARIIREIAANHIVIVVTHDPETLLEISQQILFLNQDQPASYGVQNFVAKSLAEPEFYPLPEWYLEALQPFREQARLPLLKAGSVMRFLQGAASDADYLFAG